MVPWSSRSKRSPPREHWLLSQPRAGPLLSGSWHQAPATKECVVQMATVG